eukprot:TRINITY_DN1509_c0_g1_i1.p2 TRINITY_DN1509_c0_g1~~TRINITY_DN1509_c0_g1_i1.p2  ORF type:complete len:149 (-),score=8.45 TRINITY_DN1509_c0_g1_i1:51-497(-)
MLMDSHGYACVRAMCNTNPEPNPDRTEATTQRSPNNVHTTIEIQAHRGMPSHSDCVDSTHWNAGMCPSTAAAQARADSENITQICPTGHGSGSGGDHPDMLSRLADWSTGERGGERGGVCGELMTLVLFPVLCVDLSLIHISEPTRPY